MKPQVRSTVMLLGLAAGAASLFMCGGCEDASAKHRETVQAQIKQANLKFQKALGSTGDSAAQALNSVVTELGQIDGGEPGQQAAKSTLAATALREIAAIKLTAAADLENAHSLQRSVIRRQIHAALRLTESANTLESATASEERQNLQREIESAQAQVTQMRAKIDELDAPISERTEIIATSKKEVDALRMKVHELRRRAQELGHADGFGAYREAVQTGRQADQIELDISQREIELDYEYTPELTLADSYAQGFDAMIKSIEAALAQLEEFARANSQQSAATRKMTDDLVGSMTAAIREIENSRANDLLPLYEEAQSTLERAASQAQSAAGKATGEDSQAARLAAAHVQETMGRLHWAKARGLADHQDLLERAANAKISTGIDTKPIAQAQQAAIEQAKQAYSAAQELITQVSSRIDPAQVEALARSLERAVASVGGAPIPTESTSEAPTPTEGSTEPPISTDFASAEELQAFLENLPQSVEGMKATVGVLHASTPEGERLLNATTNTINALAKIDAATKAKFNKSITDSLGGMGASMSSPLPSLENATIVEQTEDKIVYQIGAEGESRQIAMRKIDGRWVLSVDELAAGMAEQFPMMEQMASSLATAADSIVQRIESGQIKSMQEVMMAFGQAMMGGMGGMTPGGPNTPEK